jgi:hypothetical protein
VDYFACSLVVPAAGDSVRYKGLAPIKGLLKFKWREKYQTMIEHCIPTRWTEQAVIVCKESDHPDFITALPNHHIVPIHTSIGQANSVYHGVCALHKHNARDVLIINSDNGFHYDLRVFITACRLSDVPAGAVVFNSNGSADYGYVDDRPWFMKAVEKEAISAFALAGAFYFKTDVFLEAYENIGEDQGLPLSAVFGRIRSSKLAHLMLRSDLHVWGTKENLLADETVSDIDISNADDIGG